MKIVIDIPEETMNEIKDNAMFAGSISSDIRWDVTSAIVNGTPIPKGCGRLIDADQTLATAWANFYVHEDEWQKKDPDYVPLGRFYDQNGFECCQQTIVNAPTIIDKEGKE